jgi:hypothetical protein
MEEGGWECTQHSADTASQEVIELQDTNINSKKSYQMWHCPFEGRLLCQSFVPTDLQNRGEHYFDKQSNQLAVGHCLPLLASEARVQLCKALARKEGCSHWLHFNW